VESANEVTWGEFNQAYLQAHAQRLRHHLQVALDAREGRAPSTDLPAVPFDERAALEVAVRVFGLSPFERNILLLCAAPELDSGFGSLLADLNNDPKLHLPSFSLALSVLPDGHWSALSAAASLRRWRLIEIQPGTTLTSSPLRIDERILHYLAGVNTVDARLTPLLEPVRGAAELVPSQREIVERMIGAWSHRNRASLPVIQLVGMDREGRRAVAFAASRVFNGDLFALNAALLPTTIAEMDNFVILMRREVAIMNLSLLLETDEVDSADSARQGWLGVFIARYAAPLLVSGVERQRVSHRAALSFDVPKPDTTEQRSLWRAHLGDGAQDTVEQMTAQFNLSAHSIRAIHVETYFERGQDPALPSHRQSLWRAARAHARPKLDDLAQRLETRATWQDLILPEAQKNILHDITAHVRQRLRVYEHWGFAKKNARGLGISALFAGGSGTGKTTAAEILGRELDLDVYRIDLSSTVSKYIGETEKNLKRLFDAAEDGGVILLFDEADAIFGKRSEVKDSHDRYANLEVSYLLQRMESYSGLAILTSNLKSSIDTAFLRRIRFVVQFPFPDLGERTQMWSRAFPKETPTRDLEPAKLAQLQIAGGNIKNIALNAAFIAADMDQPVGMRHVYRAAEAEYAKLEKQLTGAETAGWLEDDDVPEDAV
jgi:hypothetical protein